MKKKPLIYYLDLMKSAQDKNEWNEVKRYGEIALKKLSKLSSLPIDKYLLYDRLGNAYYHSSQYSRSLEMYYNAHLIATKNQLAPEKIAHSVFMLGLIFLAMNRLNQAISQFQKVEQYYQNHGDGTFPMDKKQHFIALVSLGHCYLFKRKIENVEEIIHKKLPPYQNIIDDLSEFYHLKGEYFIAVKKYDQARQSFKEYIKIGEHLNYPYYVCAGKISLAIVDIWDGQLISAVDILESILPNKYYSLFYDLICVARILLSKCYYLKNLPNKAVSMENHIKPLLDKLDMVWLYETSREFEQLYRQLQRIYQIDVNSIPAIITYTINKYYEKSDYKYLIIGKSSPMIEIYQLIEKVVATDLPVLIQGETGTGKELIAQVIHNNSLRHEKRWLALNCGAVPESLLENELFGHKKGAFTDAKEDRKGYIELAFEGTLFLDEISEMSPNMQQKLLRVLEEKQVWRLGAEKPIPVNTRFIFASNQNIEELIKTKKFREDLYYRINTIVITLPPLRDRKDDIPLLINHFLKKYHSSSCHSERSEESLPEISSSTLALLMCYHWPGNVRELENEIRRICALYQSAKEITENMLSESIRNYKPFVIPLASSLREIKKQASDDMEKKVIIEELKKSNGNITQTARHLGCHRFSLQRKIKRLKIEIPAEGITKK